MTSMPSRHLLPTLLLSAAALAGCGDRTPEAAVEATPAPAAMQAPPAAPAPAPTPPPVPAAGFAVAGVELGKTVGSDMKVTAAVTTFAPTDTIHASVSTTGAAADATVTGRWLYQDGQVVYEDTKTVSTDGPATHDFSISKPDGFPAGTYKFELWVNGALSQAREFTVQESAPATS